MKKLLLAPLIALCSCADNHKANQLVSKYVKSHTNDANSYQSVSFDRPRLLTYGDITNGKSSGAPAPGVLIGHSFRVKNEMGALVLHAEGFVVDSIGKRVQPLSIMRDSIAAVNNRHAEIMADRLEHAADSVADAMRSY
jgi:hypothetical protein